MTPELYMRLVTPARDDRSKAQVCFHYLNASQTVINTHFTRRGEKKNLLESSNIKIPIKPFKKGVSYSELDTCAKKKKNSWPVGKLH
ncbi:TPA: hypothetical protein GDO54_018555 [Pyxicephalus adspersus]|uniref:Uncharacterized protein n=1 Tax=Pyxicephalus adspersus TaxID=30357 RepID=A0AAV2ZPH1_PYXAD|nr:TPA: hypothetical protein GDO54_018555 [Pyxicephalus adspersus]